MTFLTQIIDWFRDADGCYWHARAFHLKGQYEEAIRYYSMAIEKDARHAHAYDARGTVWGLLRDNVREVEDYEAATRLQPEHAGMLGNLGRALVVAGDLPRAVRVGQAAVALDPGHANNHALLAHAQRLAGDFAGALASCTKSIELSGTDVEHQGWSYRERGLVQQALGDHASAVADFTKVIEDFPPTEDVRQERAGSYFQLGRYDLALADIDVAMKRHPEAAYPWSLRGYIRMRKGDDAAARADFDRALELDAKHLDALRGRAHVLARSGAHERAIADLTQVIEIDPEGVDPLMARGLAYLSKNDFGRAAEDYTRVLEKNPGDANAMLNRGICRERLGDDAGMREDYTRVLAGMSEPTSALEFNNRAWLRCVLGQAEAALPDAERAVALEPEDAVKQSTLGHVLEALGRREEAIARLRAALERRPDAYVAAKVHSALGRLGAD